MHLNNTILPFNYSSPLLPGEHGVIVFLRASLYRVIMIRGLLHILFKSALRLIILFLAVVAVSRASHIA